MMDQQTHKGPGPRGWRKVVVVGGSLAVLAVGGAATANQAFADRGAGTESGTPEGDGRLAGRRHRHAESGAGRRR